MKTVKDIAYTLASAMSFIGSMVAWVAMMRSVVEGQWMDAVAWLALFVVTYTAGMLVAEA